MNEWVKLVDQMNMNEWLNECLNFNNNKNKEPVGVFKLSQITYSPT